ncbi:TraE/TraK family type IV conjugative transfer system protein [Ferrimonas kyonanensis]|uniref:TraE/TraK family type IV conjugative transfer system protein n=1 Tax=Ferrimonas kyonanensis TaxID=364763 RepID=UPI000422051E|nr:TraE/TraK family type IV conjugative transfer system protein [Ferrimonas kyonanensis]
MPIQNLLKGLQSSEPSTQSRRSEALERNWTQASKLTPVLIMTIAVLAVINAMVVYDKLTQEPWTQVIPQNFDGIIEIKEGEANQIYNTSFALSFTQLVANISPRSVDKIIESLEPSLSPALQATLPAELEKQATIIKARKVQQVFLLDNIYYDEITETVYVFGNKLSFVKGEPAGKALWTYEWRIKPNSGRPRIMHYDSYAGKPGREVQRGRKDRGEQQDQPIAIDDPFLDVETEVAIAEKGE